MKDGIGKFTQMYVIWKANLRLKYAIRKAEKAHRKTGDRYYVMPDAFDRLVIMRRKGMRNLRRHGIMDNHVRMPDVLKESFYCTADKAGNQIPQSIIENKRVMYIKYVIYNRTYNANK